MTDLDPESLHVLELARAARTPSEQDKARVGRRVALAVGASAVATASAGAGHAEASTTLIKAAGSTGVAKWIGGGALLAAAAVGYVALASTAAHKAAPNATRVAPVVVTVPAPAPAPGSGTDAPAAQAPGAADQGGAFDPARAADVQPTPHRVAHRHQPGQVDSLAAELELLHRAQSAWRARQADSALSLLNEHRTRYPHSQLDLERDALQVLTLCELGRSDEAKRIAHSVLARAPHSPLRASLEQSCALK